MPTRPNMRTLQMQDTIDRQKRDADRWRRAYEDAYRALKYLNECCGQEIAEYQAPEDVQTVLGLNGRVHSVNGWDVPTVRRVVDAINSGEIEVAVDGDGNCYQSNGAPIPTRDCAEWVE
jgi:hypothetical protein